ncbi:MAG: DUF1338 family protein [Pseudomonadota bacterium]
MNPLSQVPADELRARFSQAMSDMYREEVPLYGDLIDIVAKCNDDDAAQDDRLPVERHGAIRLGTPEELGNMRRVLAVLGLQPVGYYDLSTAGVPVHSTAFRPVGTDSLRRSPFRLFTSLLRLELIEDAHLREQAREILARRQIFSARLLEIVARHEEHGALSPAEAEEFLQHALDVFRWQRTAAVSRTTYDALHDAHRLLADVVCFRGPHINHLTPRTTDIDKVQARMLQHGIDAKESIEGPPARKHPILLRQTSFKALEESVHFCDDAVGSHTARFGEVEQRGMALTRKGRALYDSLLAQARAGMPISEVFQQFPDDLDALRKEGLAFFRYSVREGQIHVQPLVYEDFLPVSAAGIFQSNLGEGGAVAYSAASARDAFEQALGCAVIDEMALYAKESAASLSASLAKLLGPSAVLAGDDAAAYESGARYGEGRAACVVRPASVEEVQAVVRICAAQCIRVVVQGANTGLTGASTPDTTGEQIVLSMERLRATCDVDPDCRTVTVDAGLTLEELNAALLPHDLWFPVDLGANPQVGGMIAANTGGTRLIRYGDVRHNLLAVEAVLFHPAGERVRFGRALRKDNTGLDLKQILVGASGATGVITQAVLEVQRRPRQTATAMVAPASDEAVMVLLLALESELGDFLAAFEGISSSAIHAACDHVPGLALPFEGNVPEFSVLIELESSVSHALTGLDLQDVLNRFLEDRFDTLVSDAIVGSTQELWRLRHAVSEATRRIGLPVTFDVSIPRSRLMAFRRAARELVRSMAPELEVFDFGHIADGGMHFNLVWPHTCRTAFDATRVESLRQQLYRLVVEEFGGSFSAEHGIGPHNQSSYDRFTSAVEKCLAGKIQRLVDPMRLCGVVDFGAERMSEEAARS